MQDSLPTIDDRSLQIAGIYSLRRFLPNQQGQYRYIAIQSADKQHRQLSLSGAGPTV